jgi:uncharacterized membrane protein YhaH (DUF805 family)
MGFTQAVQSVLLKNYANFKGRASRSEYWFYILFYMIIYMIFGFIITQMPSLSFLGILYLGLIIPSIAVTARRMHDVDKSGWFMLIPFYSLYLVIIKGTSGPNRFGEDSVG